MPQSEEKKKSPWSTNSNTDIYKKVFNYLSGLGLTWDIHHFFLFVFAKPFLWPMKRSQNPTHLFKVRRPDHNLMSTNSKVVFFLKDLWLHRDKFVIKLMVISVHKCFLTLWTLKGWWGGKNSFYQFITYFFVKVHSALWNAVLKYYIPSPSPDFNNVLNNSQVPKYIKLIWI